MKTNLKKIKAFCRAELIPLNEIQSPHQTGYISKKRRLLLILLTDVSGWPSKTVAVIINRKASTVRRHANEHRGRLKVDKHYKKDYEALKVKYDLYHIDKVQRKNAANFKACKLINLKTNKEHNFNSLGKACKFLKCTGGLLNYYKNKNIDEFLGFKIIYL